MICNYEQIKRLVREVLQIECSTHQESPLMDPMFNVREMCKEFTLIEDHLNHDNKRCFDCINKHFLKCEALAEEAISLDGPDGHEHPFLFHLPGAIRRWHNQVHNSEDMRAIASDIRSTRKDLTQVLFQHQQ
ncbi:hypothetical protein CMI47_19460 [Candidatus Pacearchaeota archaeon]|nr:hypothetical protein [Candidatus Pacearchaeota archaeon]